MPSSYSFRSFLLSRPKRLCGQEFYPGYQTTSSLETRKTVITGFWILGSEAQWLTDKFTDVLSSFSAPAHDSPREQFPKPQCWNKTPLTLARALLGMGSDINIALGKIFLERTKLASKEGKKTASERGVIAIFLGV